MLFSSRLKTRWVCGSLLGLMVSSSALAVQVDFQKTVIRNADKVINLNESIGTFPMRFNNGKLEVFLTLRAASDRPIGQTINDQETGYQWDWTGGTPDSKIKEEAEGDMNLVFKRELEEEVGLEGAKILGSINPNVPHHAFYNPFNGKYVWLRLILLSKEQGDRLEASAKSLGQMNAEKLTASTGPRNPGLESKQVRDEKDPTKYKKGVGSSFTVDAQWVPAEFLDSLVANVKQFGPEKGSLATKFTSKADWLKKHEELNEVPYPGARAFGFRKFLGLLSTNPGFTLWSEQLRVLMSNNKVKDGEKESSFGRFVRSIEEGKPDFSGLSDVTPAVDFSVTD